MPDYGHEIEFGYFLIPDGNRPRTVGLTFSSPAHSLE
jgi:hypothetical protein